MRISNSFSEGEIQVLDFILSTLLRGGDACMARRSKDFKSVYRKVLSMKKKAVEMRGGPLAPLVAASDEGSGIIARAERESAEDEVSAE